MDEKKFNSIKKRAAGLTAAEYAKAYPQLTEDQIKLLTQGEADEPSRKSVFSFTKTND